MFKFFKKKREPAERKMSVIAQAAKLYAVAFPERWKRGDYSENRTKWFAAHGQSKNKLKHEVNTRYKFSLRRFWKLYTINDYTIEQWEFDDIEAALLKYHSKVWENKRQEQKALEKAGQMILLDSVIKEAGASLKEYTENESQQKMLQSIIDNS